MYMWFFIEQESFIYNLTMLSRYARILLIFSLLTPLSAVAADRQIQIMALFPGKVLVKIDGKQHLLGKGRKALPGIRFISADSKMATLEIDGQTREFTLGSGTGQAIRSGEGDKPVVRIWSNSSGMHLTTVYINDRAVNCIVDTGASSVALNARQAKALGIDYLNNSRPIIITTASGDVPGYEVNLARVKLGDVELHNIKGNVIEGSHPPVVLLGMSFLQRFSIKREHGYMELQFRQ